MNKAEAWHAFWSRFGWKAYNESTVPDNAFSLNDNRYITYQSATGNLGQPLMLSVSLWHRSNSWTTIHAKEEEILAYIDRMYPPSIPIDGGRLRIVRGTPPGVDEPDEDPAVRRVRLNIIVEFLTES